jgi:hypothetical protein
MLRSYFHSSDRISLNESVLLVQHAPKCVYSEETTTFPLLLLRSHKKLDILTSLATLHQSGTSFLYIEFNWLHKHVNPQTCHHHHTKP